MNLALLERHAYEEHRPSAGDWLFVVADGALLIVLAIAVAAAAARSAGLIDLIARLVR